MSEALELHIVRLDVFLHCLGGYGSVKPRVRRNKHELLTDDEIIEIRRLATSTYMPYGAVQDAAERLAIPYRSFVVMLHHCRRGREPKHWRYVPTS